MDYWNELQKYDTTICTECGMEYKKGLMQWMDHDNKICKNNAPNKNITAYHDEQERLKAKKIYDNKINQAHKKMTDDEICRHNIYRLSGMVHYDETNGMTVWMGSKAMERLRNFEREMFKKYNIK